MQSVFVPRRLSAAAPKRAGRGLSLRVCASVKASQLLDEAAARYNSGDRMGALKAFEESLNEQPTDDQRRQALYGATCVHASFGDLELAKMSLRQGVAFGLDWDGAIGRGDWVPFTASTQVKIQLRAFAENVARQIAAQAKQDAQGGSSGAVGGGGRPTSSSSKNKSFVASIRDVSNQNAEELLSTSIADGMDASVGAIVRRVAILLLVMVVSGIAMFYIGLATLFPTDGAISQ